MANGSFIAVTPGSGAKLATGPTYTENANVVQDEKVIFGEPYVAAYAVRSGSISTATAASHILQIMAGASLKVRIMEIFVWQQALATTTTVLDLSIARLTTAGTGGTAITAQPHDTTDAAAGAAGMSLPTVKGTDGVGLWSPQLTLTQTAPIGNMPLFHWQAVGAIKPIIIPAGTANGIRFSNVNGIAAGVISILVMITELAF